jgi:hypothetical protein
MSHVNEVSFSIVLVRFLLGAGIALLASRWRGAVPAGAGAAAQRSNT